MGISDFPVCMDIWKTLIAEFLAATTPQKIKKTFPKRGKLRNTALPLSPSNSPPTSQSTDTAIDRHC